MHPTLPLRRRALISLLVPLCAVLTARAANAPVAPPKDKWEAEMKRFEAEDAKSPPPKGGIVFTGSSSVRLWKTLAEDFPGMPVINRGFGGSEMSDSVKHMELTVLRHLPRQVIVYAGTNDIKNGKTPERVMEDFKLFSERIKAALPETRIGFIAAAPNPARWALIDQFRDLNTRAAAYCKEKGYDFIDVHTAMLGPDGKPLPDIFVADQLHMNPKGYEIWKRVIGPFLTGR